MIKNRVTKIIIFSHAILLAKSACIRILRILNTLSNIKTFFATIYFFKSWQFLTIFPLPLLKFKLYRNMLAAFDLRNRKRKNIDCISKPWEQQLKRRKRLQLSRILSESALRNINGKYYDLTNKKIYFQ